MCWYGRVIELASGMLFANDHDVGRTFIFDVRNPLVVIVAQVAVDH